MELNRDQLRPHQGAPLGVPKSYDWAKMPRMGAGNEPGGFRALTGWGQIFWNESAVESANRVQIRNSQTFLCHGAERSWDVAQEGDIEGAEFRSDFKNNTNTSTQFFGIAGGVATVGFRYGTAFHFWPKNGRANLPDLPICGVVVLLEARIAPVADGKLADWSSSFLLGLGADYWRDRTVQWDSYKTNRDVAIGRLKLVSPNWAWYGLSTASDSDLRRLYEQGYGTISR